MPAVSSAEHTLVASLIALMEAGTAPWRRPWDASGGGHHVNLLSGRRYRGANPILLTLGMHARGSLLPYWCGFAEARARGLVPRRGSKAVHVLRPQLPPARLPHPLRDAAADADTGASPSPPAWMRFRPMAVFNAADLVGEDLVALIAQRRFCEGLDQRPEPERLAGAEAALGGWAVPVSHGGDLAAYLPQLDRIQLPERSAFSSSSALYATWAHEAIHSTGHPSRLSRDLSGRFGSRTYAREELVAELGALLLGDRLEIGSQVEHHAAYLSHWISLLRERPQVLVQVLAEARRAADLIAPEPAPPPAAGETGQDPAGNSQVACSDAE